MNLFDQLVTEALKNKPDLSALRIVVEKEVLHHDILRILSHNNLLKDLTFIGGTCLRAWRVIGRLGETLVAYRRPILEAPSLSCTRASGKREHPTRE